MRSKGAALRSLNLSIRKRLTNSLEEGAPQHPLEKGLGGPQIWCGQNEVKKKSVTQSGIERREYST